MVAKGCICAWVLPLRCFSCLLPNYIHICAILIQCFQILTRVCVGGGGIATEILPTLNTPLYSLPVGSTGVKPWRVNLAKEAGAGSTEYHHVHTSCQNPTFRCCFVSIGFWWWAPKAVFTFGLYVGPWPLNLTGRHGYFLKPMQHATRRLRTWEKNIIDMTFP